MDNLLGLLRVRIKRGVNLAVRDVRSSDPYVVVKLDKQKLKTRVIKRDVNPEWNEDLTLSITDPSTPIRLTVYDHDTFSKDDKMGNAEVDIRPYIEALKVDVDGIPNGTTIARVQPCRTNCLSEESAITLVDGKVWGASNTGHRLSFLPRLVLFFLKQFEYVVKIYLIVAVELGSYIGLNKNIGNYFTTDTPLSEVIAFCTI
ncbi:hypothetical protein V6Z11_D12G302400 [Gossypium hirsutum]